MELHQLRHFIAVAEELHFGRAASKLNIVQPALTQSLRRLEAQLGAKLIVRGARTVGLTAAGAVLLDEAKRTLSQAAFAEKCVKRVVLGEVGEINVGYVEAALFKVIPPVLSRLYIERPNVVVKLSPHTTSEQLDLIADGRLDLGLIQFLGAPPSGPSVEVIDEVDIGLAVPSSWPLASRDSVSIHDLRDLPLLTFQKAVAPDFYSATMALFHQRGLRPNIRHEARGLYTFLSLVASSAGMAFLPYDITPRQIDGVTWLRIDDVDQGRLRLSIGLAWIPRALPAAIERLVEMFRNRQSA